MGHDDAAFASNESDKSDTGSNNDNYDPGDAGNSGDTGNTGNTADTGDTADTADTGNTGDSTVSDENGSETSDDDPGTQEQPDNIGELVENQFVETAVENTSTFSIDVDTASYSLVRNYIMNYHQMPPVDNVRIEEMVNYFDYEYPKPDEDKPFSVTMEMARSPWRDDAYLVMFGLKGKEIDPESVPSSNLVFLIDVSGSMSDYNKLPLIKEAFKKLVGNISEKDTISIVTYAGSAGVLLDSVSGDQKDKINSAIDGLQSGGSTAGAQGIITAYELAEKNFNGDGNNRVILATDGDFNVGPSSDAEMESLIVENRDKGIFLTVLGFGMGNFQDSKMETLADKGNGNYFYIDTEKEAEKVFVQDLFGNMFTIAKDVKLQVVFNPDRILKYRLIGYENRVMPNQDFNDDTKDAGEIGSGHRVTAFYEVVTADNGTEEGLDGESEVEFGEDDYLILRMRYKEPDEDISKYMDVYMDGSSLKDEMSQNMGFASSVVEFGMIIRDSQFKEGSSYDSALTRASDNIGDDIYGFRKEFLEIIKKAKEIDQ
ncbi:MAG TPA: VWA domain-containing protein [bacterium]|nr:VWA domain-containing protein [bacterium]